MNQTSYKMKIILPSVIFLFIAVATTGQHLVTANADVVGVSDYPDASYLVEADAESFFWISGTSYDAVTHPLLAGVYSDFQTIYFIKYDKAGVPLKANYIIGPSLAQKAFSHRGGITIMARSEQDVDANGNLIPLAGAGNLEFMAKYGPWCQLEQIVSVWNLAQGQYAYSDACMDPADGSVYLYGIAHAPMDLIGYGTTGKDVSRDYFYVIKYSSDLQFQWVYQAGFDMAASGTSPYFNKVNVFPGNNGRVLITGSYGTESSPLINGVTLPSYTDGYGLFAVGLDASGKPQVVQDGLMQGYSSQTGIYEGFPMPNGDFVVAGVTATGYFKLGNAEFFFPDAVGMDLTNQFAYRMDQQGNIVWQNQLRSMGPSQEGKKSVESEQFSRTVYHDALNWKNRILYITGYFGLGDAFTIAGRTIEKTYNEGVFVAALNLMDGSERWGYGLTSNDVRIYGFDMDRTGNISLMGANYETQDLEGVLVEDPVDATSFVFHVGLDYNGRLLWYNNARLLNGPNYFLLEGVDLEVLPNGQVFSSMLMNETNELVFGGGAVEPVGLDTFAFSNWMIELKADMQLGGQVTDQAGSPVYPGYVKAIKSAPAGSYPAVDSVFLDETGWYLFDNLYPGHYTLMVVPDPQAYPLAVPTYFGGSVLWGTANFSNIEPDTRVSFVDVQLTEVPKLTPEDGSGGISGNVSREAPEVLKGTLAHPVKQASVILLRKAKKSTAAEGDVVAYVETDEFGNFAFENVPDGDYLLIVDVTGLDMIETHEVTIEGDLIVSGLDYTVSEDGIYTYTGVGIPVAQAETLKVFPNPGDGLIFMELPEDDDYAVTIFRTDGKMLQSSIVHASAGLIRMDISSETDGIYLIRVKGPGTNRSIRYMKE